VLGFEKFEDQSFRMRVVIGTGKTFGLIDSECNRFNKFSLNPAVSYFDDIPGRVHSGPESRGGAIYADIPFFNPLLTRPPGAETGLS